MKFAEQDPLIRDTQGAALLACSKATFWRRVADGTLPPPIKIGGMSRWRLSEIEAAINAAASNRDAA
jgi:predicted DNA-binding transcriptional regulator AlpA